VSSPVSDVKAGKHMIEARADNYQPYKEEIEVRGGDEQKVAISMQFVPAALEVTMEPPDAMVKMDGKVVGKKSPVVLEDILPGKPHTFTFEHLQYATETRTWEFKPKEKRTEKIVLSEKHFDLDVSSTPKGARVKLDGVYKGVTPLAIKGLKATPQYVLIVNHYRYPAWRGTIFYDGSPVKEVRVHLDQSTKRQPSERTPGSREKRGGPSGMKSKKESSRQGDSGILRLNSKPWGKVWIDGEATDRTTPLLDYRLQAGRHKITIEFATGERKTEFVVIRPGETITKVIRK
jgi:hypothetical protein